MQALDLIRMSKNNNDRIIRAFSDVAILLFYGHAIFPRVFLLWYLIASSILLSNIYLHVNKYLTKLFFMMLFFIVLFP